MGFLSENERGQLRIEAMVLHVVGEADFDPQPARVVEHANFFIGRILDTDAAAVYQFKDASHARDYLQEMAADAITFEAGAQQLSREFSRQHGATARDGAFFIFALRTDDPGVRIYSLIKYDYREAIEQSEDDDGQQRLRRIIHAFIDDKRAIQKAALIRVVNGQADAMVAARDRTRPSPEIADYFATFLDVERTRSDDELNRLLVEALRKTFLDCQAVLPNQDAASALQQAKAVLRDRQRIDEDAIVEAVLAAAGHPADEQTQTLLRRRTAQKLRMQRLTGLEFPPNRQVLRKPPLRKLRTTEGVTVTYPDEADAVTVRRERNLDGEGEVITIITDRIVEDTVVPDRAR
ncbi:nucleoid-associated protein [uncultured Stenotrophomonas sp.]|uniref:nucleoid-associated protein n=1 Tax=uncultured Stenotrophomonas sp. TaxID=165438 RepID=UPI0025D3973F|nr:nucleoid-associated protein [uncultured Stenotrophomonas sp.]